MVARLACCCRSMRRRICRSRPTTAIPKRRGPRFSAPANVGRVRYTVDASVFVNAFNPHEPGHTASLDALAAIHRRGDAVVVPTLLLVELSAALARATDDADGARQYANAIAALPHLTLVTLSPTIAGLAAELAADHRLCGADAVYSAVARRYGTGLVTLDKEQRTRAASVVSAPRRRDRAAASQAPATVEAVWRMTVRLFSNDSRARVPRRSASVPRRAKVGGGGGIRTRVRKYIPAGIYDAYPLLNCRP
jgi:predicted nucleic acid-binding protein